jgi:hypothetical protein
MSLGPISQFVGKTLNLIREQMFAGETDVYFLATTMVLIVAWTPSTTSTTTM